MVIAKQCRWQVRYKVVLIADHQKVSKALPHLARCDPPDHAWTAKAVALDLVLDVGAVKISIFVAEEGNGRTVAGPGYGNALDV